MGGYGRIYRIPLVRTVVSVALDLAEITPPGTQVVWVQEIELNQSTEVGDAQEEMLQLAWRVGNTTTGTGGNQAVVITPQFPGDPTWTGVVDTFNTTKASGGTPVSNPIWDWPIRMRFEKIFSPDIMLFIGPSQRACLELVVAPADPTTIGGTITIEVLG